MNTENLPLSPSGTPGDQLRVRVTDDVTPTLQAMDTAVTGALAIRALDLVDHHRRRVGKQVAMDFPGKRAAQKFWFARSFRYTNNYAKTVGDVQAEGYATGIEGARERFWQNLEEGGIIRSTGKPFVIPFPKGTRAGLESLSTDQSPRMKRGSFESLYGTLSKRTFDFTRGGLVVRVLGREGYRGYRSQVIGAIRRTRQQPKLLEFRREFDKLQPEHERQIEKVFDMALTAVDRVKLAADTDRRADTLAARLARIRPGLTPQQKELVRREAVIESRRKRLASRDRGPNT